MYPLSFGSDVNTISSQCIAGGGGVTQTFLAFLKEMTPPFVNNSAFGFRSMEMNECFF